MTSNRTLGEAIEFYRLITDLCKEPDRSFYKRRLTDLVRMHSKLVHMYSPTTIHHDPQSNS